MRWAGGLEFPCRFDPHFFGLAQRNGVEPPKKSALAQVFTIAARTLRRQYHYAGNADPGEHVRPRRRVRGASIGSGLWFT